MIPFAAKAKSEGILKGDGKGRLRASDRVKLSELLTMAFRAGGYHMNETKPWYKGYMDIAKKHGFLKGVSNHSPSYIPKRGEVLNILYEFDQNYGQINMWIDEYQGEDMSDIETHTPGDSSNNNSSNNNSSSNNSSNDSSNDSSNHNHSHNNTVNTTPTQPAQNQGQFRATTPLRLLAEHMERMTPEQVYTTFNQMGQTERFILNSGYSAFVSWIHYAMCQHNPNVTITDLGVTYSCAQTAQNWATTLQFTGSMDQALHQARLEQGNVLILLKCGTGEISPASCGAYTNALGQYGNALHQTNQGIIDNIGGGCTSAWQTLPNGAVCYPNY